MTDYGLAVGAVYSTSVIAHNALLRVTLCQYCCTGLMVLFLADC